MSDGEFASRRCIHDRLSHMCNACLWDSNNPDQAPKPGLSERERDSRTRAQVFIHTLTPTQKEMLKEMIAKSRETKNAWFLLNAFDHEINRSK